MKPDLHGLTARARSTPRALGAHLDLRQGPLLIINRERPLHEFWKDNHATPLLEVFGRRLLCLGDVWEYQGKGTSDQQPGTNVLDHDCPSSVRTSVHELLRCNTCESICERTKFTLRIVCRAGAFFQTTSSEKSLKALPFPRTAHPYL